MLNEILNILLSQSAVSFSRHGDDSIVVTINKAGTVASARLVFDEIYAIAQKDLEGATDIIEDLLSGLNEECDLKARRNSSLRQKLLDRFDEVKEEE